MRASSCRSVARGIGETIAGIIASMTVSTSGPEAAPSTTASPAVVAWSRALAAGSLVGLIVLGLAWELWLAPTGSGSLALKVLPLLLPLPGLLRNRMYTYRWVSLFVWLYFIEGIVRAASDRGIGAGLGWVEVALCLTLFAACALHVRTRLRHAPAVAGPQ
jgi:uncharacterized membrane protein